MIFAMTFGHFMYELEESEATLNVKPWKQTQLHARLSPYEF